MSLEAPVPADEWAREPSLAFLESGNVRPVYDLSGWSGAVCAIRWRAVLIIG